MQTFNDHNHRLAYPDNSSVLMLTHASDKIVNPDARNLWSSSFCWVPASAEHLRTFWNVS